jgi:hypothetical protein
MQRQLWATLLWNRELNAHARNLILIEISTTCINQAAFVENLADADGKNWFYEESLSAVC